MNIIDSTKFTGVVLAGGRARRMHNQDKGLVTYNGQALVSYALQALAPLAANILINANRNLASYQQFGWPVITDHNDQFDGPLAGILAALKATTTPLVLVVPCDSPNFSSMHLQRLALAAFTEDADVVVAAAAGRLHPVFLALKTSVADNLQAYLASGERKIQTWLHSQRLHMVDYSDDPNAFININTLAELAKLEADLS